MKTWKRNGIIAVVLVLVCAGIYLNWRFSETTEDLTQCLNEEKLLGESTLVLNDTQSGEAAPVDHTQSAEEYFAQMRLSRQNARDEAITVLQETIAYAEGEDHTQSSTELEQIISHALTESQIESLVVAKGYADCVAYISEEGISLAVAAPENGMTQTDVSLLADLVMSQSDFSLSDIRIIGIE